MGAGGVGGGPQAGAGAAAGGVGAGLHAGAGAAAGAGAPQVGAPPAGGAGGGAPHVGAAPCSGAAGAGGEPHAGAGENEAGAATAGDAGAPQPPGAGGPDATGAPHALEGGGATIVGATAPVLGCAGGAQVAATPAVWLAGAGGRTGGADFFFRRRLRVIRYSPPVIRAATARIMTAYSVGMRWRASLLADHGIGIRFMKRRLRSEEVCHRGQASLPVSMTRRPDATPGTVTSASSEWAPAAIGSPMTTWSTRRRPSGMSSRFGSGASPAFVSICS